MRRSEPLDPDVARELEALDAALAGERVDADLADLAQLAEDVRSGAPPPRRGFLAELQTRLGERPAAAWWRRPELLTPALATAAAVMLGLVVVLGQLGDRRGGDAVTSPPQPAAGERGNAAAPEDAPTGVTLAPPTDDAPTAAPDSQDRRVEHVARLHLGTPREEVERVAAQVSRVTQRVGGIVASSSTSGGSGAAVAEASFELRIPVDRVDDALAALAGLATVLEREQTTTDVTGSIGSLEGALGDARAERRGLRRALRDADDEAEVQRLRARLRDAQARVDRLGGRLGAARDRADVARVGVVVSGRGDAGGGAADGADWTPGDAARDALRILEVAAGVLVVALAALVPLALLAGLGLLGARAALSHRRDRALDAAAQAGAEPSPRS